MNCMICGKRRDPETKLCPTPEACARLRQPHKRLAEEARATRRRVHAAMVAETHIGINTSELKVPPDITVFRRVG